MKLRIEEALEYAKKNGRKVKKLEIAQIMWANETKRNASAYLSAYLRDENKQFVKIEWIDGIRKLCGCTTNFLLGIEEESSVRSSLFNKAYMLKRDIESLEELKEKVESAGVFESKEDLFDEIQNKIEIETLLLEECLK